MPPGQVLKGAAGADVANVYSAGRKRIGVARLADITEVAELRAMRDHGRVGR
jgi:hypothetical protein